MGVQPYTGVDVITSIYEMTPITQKEREMLMYVTRYVRNAIKQTNNTDRALEQLYDFIEEAYAAHKGGARNDSK